MYRILIVDDDTLVRDALRLMLEHAGYDVTEAAEGGEALALHEAQKFDLVITDLIMPDVEGIETITKMKKMTPHTPLIAMSGGARIGPGQLLTIAEDCGANASFTKPIDRKEFLESVAGFLAPA